MISVMVMFALRINREVLHATAQQQVLLEIIVRPVIQFLKISRFYPYVTKRNLTKKTIPQRFPKKIPIVSLTLSTYIRVI